MKRFLHKFAIEIDNNSSIASFEVLNEEQVIRRQRIYDILPEDFSFDFKFGDFEKTFEKIDLKQFVNTDYFTSISEDHASAIKQLISVKYGENLWDWAMAFILYESKDDNLRDAMIKASDDEVIIITSDDPLIMN